MSRLRRVFRLLLVCLALETGGMLVAPATAWMVPGVGIIAVSSPALAQSSGGYSRPGGAAASGGSLGGRGGFDRRPAIGGGGYGRPSGSAFSGFGLDSSRGGDLAISRRSSSQALQDYRASQELARTRTVVDEPPSVNRLGRQCLGHSPAAASFSASRVGWGSLCADLCRIEPPVRGVGCSAGLVALKLPVGAAKRGLLPGEPQ